MVRSVVDQVAMLAKALQVARPIVGRSVIEVRRRRGGDGGSSRKDSRHRRSFN
jgi:hypothetical protein